MHAGAQPYAIPVPMKQPLDLRAATEKELARMEVLGVLLRVEGHGDRCAQMVVASRSSRDARICVNLNKRVKRENCLLPWVEETLAALEDSSVFSKIDANPGFRQIDRDKVSGDLKTFITPFKIFKFK